MNEKRDILLFKIYTLCVINFDKHATSFCAIPNGVR